MAGSPRAGVHVVRAVKGAIHSPKESVEAYAGISLAEMLTTP